jgi:4-amino-4-deoxy-L-arabinose transferase-like glycosyltransferase
MKISLTPRQWVLTAILALAVTPYFLCLGASSLWDSNEAFYAETPREMIESGDYINPTFNYRARLNKPPLSYWLVAPSYKLFGVSEAAERLPIVLGALIMVAVAYALGRTAFSVDAGLLAAIALAAAPRFLMFSRRIMIDVYVAVFMSIALLLFVLAERTPERRRIYLILMYVAIGLGVITKGPVAFVLPGAVLIAYLLVLRKFGRLQEMMIPIGCVIAAVIVLPWYVAIYFQNGWAHIATFILQDNLSRYTQPVWGPQRGFFFFVPALIGDFFPWSLFMIPLVWLGAVRLWAFFRNRSTSPVSSTSMIMALWILVIIGFFSISRSKEDLYILPVYPASAALVGGLVARFLDRDRAGFSGLMRATTLVLALSLVVAGSVILFLFGKQTAGAYEIAGAKLVGPIAIVGGLIAAIAVRARRPQLAVLATVVSVALCNWLFVLQTLPDFERFKPVRPLCEVIAAQASPDALVGYYRSAYPSMTFYLRRPIFEYYHEDEIESALSSGKEIYCLMTETEYDALKPRVPSEIRVLASHPIFQVKLNGILDKVELPRVVLISNKGGTDLRQ